MVDAFSRWKMAVYIPDKKGTTVTEAICKEWIKYFGPMKYLQADRGKEWLNKELQSFCHFNDIKFTTTASFTPNANSLCERGHAICDRMLEKMCTADPSLHPTIVLCWAIHAANSMDLVDGISPFLLVFGRQPNHPSLINFKPGNQLELPVSDRLSQQLNTMLSARETFAGLEADKTLRAALNQRIYSNHLDIHAKDWIYYKTNVDRVWKGPVRVTSKEGKRLYILSAGQLLTVNTDDVLLHKSEDQFNAVGDEFISIPNPDKETSTAQNSANVIISGDRDLSVDPDIDLGFQLCVIDARRECRATWL